MVTNKVTLLLHVYELKVLLIWTVVDTEQDEQRTQFKGILVSKSEWADSTMTLIKILILD